MTVVHVYRLGYLIQYSLIIQDAFTGLFHCAIKTIQVCSYGHGLLLRVVRLS